MDLSPRLPPAAEEERDYSHEHSREALKMRMHMKRDTSRHSIHVHHDETDVPGSPKGHVPHVQQRRIGEHDQKVSSKDARKIARRSLISDLATQTIGERL